mgnify:FL=1
MNKRIFIVHSYPIQYFPPAFNMVAELKKQGILIKVKTTLPVKCGRVMRLLRSLWFELSSLVQMILWKPDVVLYYESSSALSPYFYKRYFNHNVRVFAHYHEYMTPAEYNRPGMRVSAYNHAKEQSWLYEHIEWVSHTNEKRVELFLKNNPSIQPSRMHILPNYPPKSWWRKQKVHGGDVCKCVYVGSLSLKDTFVLEFCEWVARQKGRVTFDIYCFNFHTDTLQAVMQLQCPWITFNKEGVKYQDIPNLLDGYDVGLLLYRATTVNFKWNATNKLYEYLICGLDVWYPKEMTYIQQMDKTKFSLNIIEMDFERIDSMTYNIQNRIVDNTSYNLFADDVYGKFIHTQIEKK